MADATPPTPSWAAFMALLGSLRDLLGSLGAARERSLRGSGRCQGVVWGACWRVSKISYHKVGFGLDVEATWRRLVALLEPSWDFLGPSWAALGRPWALLGALMEPLVAILGHLGTIRGPSRGHLGHLKTQIAEKLKNAPPPTRNAHFGVAAGANWAQVGPR